MFHRKSKRSIQAMINRIQPVVYTSRRNSSDLREETGNTGRGRFRNGDNASEPSPLIWAHIWRLWETQ